MTFSNPVCTENLIQYALARWIRLACLEKVSLQFLSLQQDFRRPVTADADSAESA
jgi:hypothetical protein